MKLELQVCTLEQAKRLRELGIVQESAFYHRKYQYSQRALRYGGNRRVPQQQIFEDISINKDGLLASYSMIDCFSAFTVAELGLMLESGNGHVSFSVDRTWRVDCMGFLYSCTSEAEARAALLIEALEKKYVSPEQANQRLTT